MQENPPIHAILNAVTDEKPKIFQSGRDITYSLAAILAVMIASVAFTGMCSYGRNTPQNMPVAQVDAATPPPRAARVRAPRPGGRGGGGRQARAHRGVDYW